MKKHILAIILSLWLVAVLLPANALAADAPATSGTCGESAIWSYDQTTKTLTISGNGEIDLKYDSNTENGLPWSLSSEVEMVEFTGNGFTAIGDYAFRDFYNLANISIPEGVTIIGSFALSSPKLTEVTIPNTVNEIRGNAFAGTPLVRVTIPASVEKLGLGVFVGCDQLEKIVVQAKASAVTGPLFSGGDVILGTGRINCPKLTSVGPIGSGSNIEISWDAIPAGVFMDCNGLREIIIPDTIAEIGHNAFAETGVTEVTIPAHVTKLGTNIFNRCQNLSHIIIKADASAITGPLYSNYTDSFGNQVIGCPLLTSVGPIGSGSSIEIGGDTIPASAFAGCVGLQTITIPETVKTIGDQAFNTCTGLTQITIPDTVTTIGSRAISYCPNLKVLNIPASVIRINNGHDGMFGGCTNLETITVDSENTVYTAQDGALFSKEKTTLYCVPQGKSGFTIPVGVNKIENGAFSGCTKLTEINIPSGVTEIGYDAFTDCSGLTKLVIPDGVMSNFFNFRGCTALTEVTLPGSANYYSSINGPSLTTVRILEGTKEISGTFSGVTTLTDVYLPASLTHISQNTFANCSNLKNVYFAGTQAQWDALTIADGNQELSLATVVCTGAGENPPVDPDNPDIPAPPETLGITAAPGGLGQRLTVQVQSGHWLTIQTRRAGSIAISSIQAPTSAGGMVTVAFSAPSGSIVQVWETENELTFVNGVPTNPILKTVVKEL